MSTPEAISPSPEGSNDPPPRSAPEFQPSKASRKDHRGDHVGTVKELLAQSREDVLAANAKIEALLESVSSLERQHRSEVQRLESRLAELSKELAVTGEQKKSVEALMRATTVLETMSLGCLTAGGAILGINSKGASGAIGWALLVFGFVLHCLAKCGWLLKSS